MSGFIRLKRPWTRKPPDGVPINWDHPFVKGMIFFCKCDRIGTQWDLIQNRPGPEYFANSGLNLETTRRYHKAGTWGPCLDQQNENTTPNSYQDEGGWNFGHTGGSGAYEPTDAITIISRAHCGDNPGSGDARIISKKMDAASNDTWALQKDFSFANEFNFRLNDSSGPGLLADDAIIRTGGTLSWLNTTIDIALAADTSAFGWDNYIWVPETGEYYDSLGNASAVNGIDTSTSDLIIGARQDERRSWDGHIEYVAIWNRKLTKAQIDDFRQNPWQIFEPREITIRNPVPTTIRREPTYIRRKWTEKPPPGTPIDFTNPLTKDLKLAWAFNEGAGLPRQLVPGGFDLEQVVGNELTWSRDEHGLHMNSAAQPNRIRTTVNVDPRGTHADIFNNTTIITALKFTTMNPATNYRYFGNNDNFESRIDDLNSAIEPEIHGNHPEGSPNLVITQGKYEVLGHSSRASGTNHVNRMYHDGVYRHETTFADGAIIAAPLAIGAREDAPAQGMIGNIYYFFVWGRVLSDAEIQAFSFNPWQVFEPRYLPVPSKKAIPSTAVRFAAEIERPWTKQPPPGTPLNWDHPAMKYAIFLRDGHSKRELLTGQMPTNSTATGDSGADPGRAKDRYKGVDYTGVLADVDVYTENTVVTDKFDGLSELSIMAVVNADTLTAGTDEQRYFHMPGSTGAHNVSMFYLDTKVLSAAQRACAGFIDQDPAVTGAFVADVVFEPNKTYSIGGRYQSGQVQWCHLWAPDIGHHNGTSSGTPIATLDTNRPIWVGGRTDAGEDKTDGVVIFLAAFNKFLPQSMMESLLENPWQLYEPRKIRIGSQGITPTPPDTTPRSAPSFRRPWRSMPPPGKWEIDWDNPFTKDLMFACAPNLTGDKQIDLVTGYQGTIVETVPASVNITPNRPKMQFNVPHCVGDALQLDADCSIDFGVHSEWNSPAQENSMVCFFYPETPINDLRGSYPFTKATTVPGANEFATYVSDITLGELVIERIRYRINGVGDLDFDRVGGSPDWANQWIYLAGSCDSSSMDAWLWSEDGAVLSATGLGGSVVAQTSKLGLYGRPDEDRVMPGYVFLALAWNRAKSAEFHAELFKNPWQIFKPRQLPITSGFITDNTISASASVLITPTALLTALGELNLTGALSIASVADLLGRGELDINGALAFAVTGNADARGLLTSSPALTFSPTTNIVATGELDINAAMAFAPTADLLATGELNFASAMTFTPTANLDAFGQLDAATTIVFSVSAQLGSEKIFANPQIVITPTALLTSINEIQSAASLVVTPTADLEGQGQLDAAGAMQFTITATGRSDNEISAAASMVITPNALLISQRIFAQAAMTLTPTADIDAFGFAQANPTVTLSLTGSVDALGRLDIDETLTFAAVPNMTSLNLIDNVPTFISISPNAKIRNANTSEAIIPLTIIPTADGDARGALSGNPLLLLDVNANAQVLEQLNTLAELVLATNANMQALSALDINALITIAAAGNLEALGDLQSTAALTLSPLADLVGFGRLSANPNMQITENAVIEALGQATAQGSLIFDVTAVGKELLKELAQANPQMLLDATGLLAPITPSMDINAQMTFTPTADADAFGALSGNPTVVITPNADISLIFDGSMAAQAALVVGGRGKLLAVGALDALSTLLVTVGADIDGGGALGANPQVQVTVNALQSSLNEIRANPALILDMNVVPTLHTSAFAQMSFSLNALAELILGVADVEHIGYITRLVEDIGYITRLLEAGGYITRSVDAEGLITQILEKDLHV